MPRSLVFLFVMLSCVCGTARIVLAQAGNPDGVGQCRNEHSGPNCPCDPGHVKYTVEITCDCGANGQPVKKTLQACAPPSDYPTNSQSNCRDWVNSGDFSYHNMDLSIGRAGVDYLRSLKCPALDCYRNSGDCRATTQGNFDKCLTRTKLGFPPHPDCVNQASNDDNACEQQLNACLKDAGRAANPPVPQPHPTPPAPSPTPNPK